MQRRGKKVAKTIHLQEHNTGRHTVISEEGRMRRAKTKMGGTQLQLRSA